MWFTKSIARHFVLVSLLTMWGVPAVGNAQQQELSTAGKASFQLYCASCHGREAKGDGPAMNLLTVKPADLTQINKRNKGTFPFWTIYRVIDGREDMKGHGDRDMPILGAQFRAESGSGATTQSQVRGRILELVYYLESIQSK